MAAESYATNQWYNLGGGVAGPDYLVPTATLARTDKDNPEFLFPGKVRKNLGGGPDTTIQRGFIRSLLTEIKDIGTSIPNRRFFFQFNPERIMRSVSVSSGLMNPLLQDPGQFSVATPGNATFSFDILLNREMEVNNATQGIPPPLGLGDLSDVVNGVPRPRPDMVGQIGVLADLLVMDSIIGQGISDDIISALSRITSISSSWDTSDTSSGEPVAGAPAVNPNFISEPDATKAFNTIRGNSAFLVSTPVRIVFSSMFMVDGFIQGSSVNFTKFNTHMVPTMCAINVTVEAKYIGFAQKDTYLTEALKKAQESDNTSGFNPVIDGPEYDLLNNAIKELSSYKIEIGGTDNGDHPDKWATDGGPDLRDMLDYTTFLLRAGFTEAPGTKTKGIGKLFWEGNYSTLTFKHRPSLQIYRQFSDAAEKGLAESTGLTGLTTRNAGTFGGVTGNVLLMDVQGITATCFDWDSWQKFYSYGGQGRGPDEFGGDANEAKVYDNITNSVLASAKAVGITEDYAENLYLSSKFAPNAATVPLLIIMKLEIEASIVKDKKESKITFFQEHKVVITSKDSVSNKIILDPKQQFIPVAP